MRAWHLGEFPEAKNKTTISEVRQLRIRFYTVHFSHRCKASIKPRFLECVLFFRQQIGRSARLLRTATYGTFNHRDPKYIFAPLNTLQVDISPYIYRINGGVNTFTLTDHRFHLVVHLDAFSAPTLESTKFQYQETLEIGVGYTYNFKVFLQNNEWVGEQTPVKVLNLQKNVCIVSAHE